MLISSSAWGQEKALPSFSEPNPSPDGSQIAFASGGDIWMAPSRGGQAHLVVSHPATESRPMFSPDGTRLAFVSDRTGNGDIYILTLANGQLRRLTFSDVPDRLDAWSRDGKWIYFTSGVNDIGGSTDIFRVSAGGGTPLEVSRDEFLSEYYASPSPDGRQVAFVARGFSMAQWWRHGHSHLDESEIWLKPIDGDAGYQRLVGGGAKQDWPMWAPDGRTLYFVSDKSGDENLWALDTRGGAQPKQTTHLTGGRFLFPSITADGKAVYFERNFAIWRTDTANGRAAEVPIELVGAADGPAVTHQRLGEFTSLALSPDGKKVAVTAHGEIFAASAKDGGDAIRVTKTPAVEDDVHWSADSKRIVYISNRNGNGQVFLYDFTTSKETQLTSSVEEDELPVFSPDGKWVAFVRAGRDLRVLPTAGGAERVVTTGYLREPTVAWSPDSQWIAYASVGAKSFRNVLLAPAAGGAGRPVSFLANGETALGIAWSHDGKYLLFDTAQRSEPSQIARVDLVPRLPKFREDQFQDLFKVERPSGAKLPAGEKTPAEGSIEKPADVKVNFDGVRNRLDILPLGLDAEAPMISPDGKTLLFPARVGGQINLFTYSLDELAREKPVARQLTSTAGRKQDYAFTPDSKEVFFLDGGKVMHVTLESRQPKPLSLQAEMEVDFNSEKMAAFEQAWSLLNRLFFDPSFHGVDWNRERAQYAPYVLGSRTPAEMRRIVSLMIGDLNASHCGIAGPAAFPPSPVGRLGLRFDRGRNEAGDGLFVREVLAEGPASVEGTIRPGDRLTAVNGQAIGPNTNLDALLEDEAGKKVVVDIAAGGDQTRKRTVTLQSVTTAQETHLRYREWVEEKRAYVDRVSKGKLGYVHIADMSEASLTQLYVDLDAANETRQGVVIDLRANHGGFVNGHVLDVFARRNYLTMTRRGLDPVPSRAYLGQRALGTPTVLVTNEESLSDAEDFTEGYRFLKLGKVVGEPTAGWIIYTWGEQLIDGSFLRLPEVRVQGADGKTMEMNPRPVDVEVQRPVGEWIEGRDSQLDRAIEVLLNQTSH